MAAKEVKLGSDARDSIARGIDKLAEAVKATLGPSGCCVAIKKSFGGVRVTKDGVTVAKEIEFEDKFEDMGAQMVREVASKTNDNAGDGTTTATCLAQAMVREGLKAITAGRNPMDVKRGIDAAVQEVVAHLKDSAKQVSTFEEICQVATISANGDGQIGKDIAMAMEKVGKKGVITIDEGKTAETEVKIVEGMQFDRGFLSPYFVTNSEKMVAEFDNPYILIHEKKITGLHSLVPLLEQVVQSSRPLLIIAEDIEGEALTALIINKLRIGLRIAACKAPGFGERRKEMLHDIAVLTGATFISEEVDIKLEKVTINHLGTAKKVTMTKEETVVVDGGGDKSKVAARIAEIERAISDTKSDYDREKLQERLAKLSDGVAMIMVGDATDVALKEKKDRFEDALNATRAAVQEGVVSGGGTALLRAAQKISVKGSNDDQNTGIDIVRKAISAPCKQIIKNTGEEPALIVSKILENKSQTFGYDAQKAIYGDMHAMGILDPVKVVRCALQDSSSIVGMFLMTEAAVAELPKKEAPAMPPGMGGGMDMM